MKKIKNERGQSLVELALSITMLAWLLAGAAEFGIALFQYIQLRDAAQEGALYGSINPGDIAGITERVQYASASPIDLAVTTGPDAVTIGISAKDINGVSIAPALVCPGGEITVVVTYNHRIFIPFAKLFTGGNNITIRGSVSDTVLNSLAPGC